MRQRNAQAYSEALEGTKGLVLPVTLPGQRHVFNQYVIRSDRRDALRKFLSEKGIGAEIYYPLSLHMQECFSYLGYKEGDFPESERAASYSLAIPMYPELTENQREEVIDAIKEFQEN